jgi:hypothetical protein
MLRSYHYSDWIEKETTASCNTSKRHNHTESLVYFALTVVTATGMPSSGQLHHILEDHAKWKRS